MDGIYHELSRKTDPAKLLGYLNFSDGRPDPKYHCGSVNMRGDEPNREKVPNHHLDHLNQEGGAIVLAGIVERLRQLG